MAELPSTYVCLENDSCVFEPPEALIAVSPIYPFSKIKCVCVRMIFNMLLLFGIGIWLLSLVSNPKMSMIPINKWNFLNVLPCRGFVKKSATISSVEQCFILISPLWTQSFTTKKSMSMWRKFPVHKFRPFCSILIALCLSWGNSFLLTSTPCTPRKLSNQI